ncbi:MAG: NADH-quinone oxidoreductase subunit D [Thermoproteus sp.]
MGLKMEQYGLVLREVEGGPGGKKTLELLFGPQHPTSGHIRFFVELDGDIIVDIRPDPGFVHRTMEKLGETRHFIMNVPLFERLSLPDAINVTWAYSMAVEKMMEYDVSERAEYLRTLFGEMSRISVHLYDLALHAIMIGSSTGFMYGFGLRDLLVNLWAIATGARTTPTWVLPGGVRRAPPKAFYDRLPGFLDFLERKLDEFYKLVVKNPAGYARLKDVGYLSKEEAAAYLATGPGARGSGVDWDTRRDMPYGVYKQVEWEVKVQDAGDSLARTMVRIEEIKESAKIIRQLLKVMPMDGPLIGHAAAHKIPPKEREMLNELVRMSGYYVTTTNLAEGTGMTEGGRGRYFFQVFGSGGSNLFRVRISTPSWQNLRAFMKATIGARLMDLPAIYGSFGFFPPEADR